MEDHVYVMHLGVCPRGSTALLLCRLSVLIGLASTACGSAKERTYADGGDPASSGPTSSGGGGTLGTSDTGGSTSAPSGGSSQTAADTGGAGGSGNGSGASGHGGDMGGGGETDSGGGAGGPATDLTSTEGTTGIVEVPFVPGPAGLDVVSSGAVVKSPRFTLVMSVGQSPGGNAWLESSRFSLASGLVGTMR